MSRLISIVWRGAVCLAQPQLGCVQDSPHQSHDHNPSIGRPNHGQRQDIHDLQVHACSTKDSERCSYDLEVSLLRTRDMLVLVLALICLPSNLLGSSVPSSLLGPCGWTLRNDGHKEFSCLIISMAVVVIKTSSPLLCAALESLTRPFSVPLARESDSESSRARMLSLRSYSHPQRRGRISPRARKCYLRWR